MWKSHGPRTSVSILNKFYKIIILFVSLVIYWQVQILTSQSIFSKFPKINSLLNFLHFFWIVGTSQDYVSRLWPFLDVVVACTGCGHICPSRPVKLLWALAQIRVNRIRSICTSKEKTTQVYKFTIHLLYVPTELGSIKSKPLVI